MVSQALELVTPTQRDVARWIGTSYASIRAYAIGGRTPPPEVRQKLAQALREHAKRLVDAAERLEAQAEQDQDR